MNKSDDSANQPDPSLAPFENYLRRFQPRVARLNLDEIVQPKGSTQYLPALSDVTEPISPILVSLPSATHFPSASAVASTWPWMGAAWAGGMVMGCLLMFVLMSRFQNDGVNSASTIGSNSMQASLDQNGFDQKELVRTSRDQNATLLPAADSIVSEEPKQTGETNSRSNRSQQYSNLAYVALSDEFAMFEFDFDKSNRGPRSLVSYYSQLSSRNSGNWLGLADNQPRDQRIASQPRSFSPSSPRQESEEETIYQLQINLPSTSQTLNQHQLTQELMKEFSL